MSRAGVRVGVGTRFHLDGTLVEVVEMVATTAGNEVAVKDGAGRILRLSLKELLFSERAGVVPDEPGAAARDLEQVAAVVLGQLREDERAVVLERAEHVREVLTGFRAGCIELARPDEPRLAYTPGRPLEARYAAKAAELGVSTRSVRRWVAAFRDHGEAGLAARRGLTRTSYGQVDERWAQTALEVMVEHTGESTPSRTMVIERTRARVIACFGAGVVPQPSRATAFRVLAQLEVAHPLFRLGARRNREIAARPAGVYGKLRPTRPGEYLLMDSTRLDVFALDPLTLRWVQAELSVGMDWYSRCITGIRLTPVSTKAVDVAAVLYQCFRPRPAVEAWPCGAVWPEHGIPRTVMVDHEAACGPGLATPPLVPETLVVDHGKVYVSEHLTSVCRRMGISIQPARLRTGRDKGPIERYFRTLREDLLQALPGYKGPDVHGRGECPEGEAFFYLDELEAMIREWTALVYHTRAHAGLVDPGVAGLRMSPAAMFEHGMARAGYIEVPRDPGLAFEFLPVKWRTIQHYGVEIDRRRYSGPGLPGRDAVSPFHGPVKNGWPFHIDPDDVTRIYFRDPRERDWRVLVWEHAPVAQMPLSEDALAFARRLAAVKYRFPDDRLAVADLLERWKVGLGTSLAERRIALRMAREAGAFDLPRIEKAGLPSVQHALAGPVDAVPEPMPDDGPGGGDEDFYADAFQDA